MSFRRENQSTLYGTETVLHIQLHLSVPCNCCLLTNCNSQYSVFLFMCGLLQLMQSMGWTIASVLWYLSEPHSGSKHFYNFT